MQVRQSVLRTIPAGLAEDRARRLWRRRSRLRSRAWSRAVKRGGIVAERVGHSGRTATAAQQVEGRQACADQTKAWRFRRWSGLQPLVQVPNPSTEPREPPPWNFPSKLLKSSGGMLASANVIVTVKLPVVVGLL